MRYYAGTRKGICSYNLVYNLLIQLLRLQSSIFVVRFSNAFWHGNDAFPKGSSQNEIAFLLKLLFCFSPLAIQLLQGRENMFSLVSLSKSKFFTSVAPVSFVQHSCRLCLTRVALVLYSCRSCLTRVALVSFVSHFCRLCLTLVL